MKFSNLMIRIVLIIGFSAGVYDHATLILFKGLFSARPEVHILFNIFWDSLLIFDLLTILLLIFHYRIGVFLGFVIVFFDAIINGSVAILDFYYRGNFVMFGLFTQIPFLIFISFAFYRIYIDSKKERAQQITIG